MSYPLSSHAEEEHFRRIADRFIKEKPVDLAEMTPFPSHVARYKTKPTLEPTLWDGGAINGRVCCFSITRFLVGSGRPLLKFFGFDPVVFKATLIGFL